jgi:predicted RNA binding protein YcfA (HicA-like mRNA interferase family)
VLKHPSSKSKRVVLPYHNNDLKKGTLRSILKQAGLSIGEFIDLL